MIIASAIKLTNGEIYVGKRHCDCFAHVIDLNRKTNLYSEAELMKLHFNCVQGFINSSLRFLNRAEAEYEAFECKQITETQTNELLSEDLW